MVELQIVILAVAGSSPVGHPLLYVCEIPRDAWHVRCLKAIMLNPAIVGPAKSNIISGNFWLRLLNDEQLSACDDLEKLVIGCEIIAALDSVNLLAA
jgi:hypothetical protein